MAFAVKFTIGDVKPLLDRLRLVKSSVANRYLRSGLAKAGRIIRQAARAKLKPDKNTKTTRTGLLRKSLSVKVSVAEGKAYAIVGPARGFREQVGTRTRGAHKGEAVYEDPANIAHLVEYGHGGPHPAPPHPFLRPAFDESKAAALAAITDELERGIVKAAREGK